MGRGAPGWHPHERVDGNQGCTHHGAGRVENTAKCGRVPAVQKAVPADRLVLDELHIIRRVEEVSSSRWRARAAGGGLWSASPCAVKFADETLVAIRPKGWPIAEPVAGDGFSGDYGNRHGHSPKD